MRKGERIWISNSRITVSRCWIWERSIAFYREALGLREVSRRKSQDGQATLVSLSDGQSDVKLELVAHEDRLNPYDLGENETHIAFTTEHFEEARELHQQMDCICYENPKKNLYFINDPDGYWLEILPCC